MGFVKAFTGALGGSLADQWKDFYMPPEGLPATAAIFAAEAKGTNHGRGANTKGNDNIITSGSKIIVPEGTALITMEDGAITGIVAEPGGFIYETEDPNAQSIFTTEDPVGSLIQSTWEKIQFGGQAGAQQLAFYVVKNFVPQKFLIQNAPVFDFGDMDNDAAEQLFNEVVGSLSAAFSNYTNDPSKGNRMSRIQGDQMGFAKSLTDAVEEGYQWKTGRGLQIVKTAIMAMEYDEDTKAMMKDVKRADALSGARGNSFMQQSVARGMQAAGEKVGGANMAFMGMGMGAAGNVMGATQQPVNQQAGVQNPANQAPSAQEADPTEKLIQMKKLLDAGVITEDEFNKIKSELLGL